MADQPLPSAAGAESSVSKRRADTPYILTLSCPDRMGIVAAVSGFLAEQGCDIVDSAQFGDRENGSFFLRMSFLSTRGTPLDKLESAFAGIARTFAMQAAFHAASARTRTLIMVSR